MSKKQPRPATRNEVLERLLKVVKPFHEQFLEETITENTLFNDNTNILFTDDPDFLIIDICDEFGIGYDEFAAAFPFRSLWLYEPPLVLLPLYPLFRLKNRLFPPEPVKEYTIKEFAYALYDRFFAQPQTLQQENKSAQIIQKRPRSATRNEVLQRLLNVVTPFHEKAFAEKVTENSIFNKNIPIAKTKAECLMAEICAELGIAYDEFVSAFPPSSLWLYKPSSKVLPLFVYLYLKHKLFPPKAVRQYTIKEFAYAIYDKFFAPSQEEKGNSRPAK